MVRAVRELFYVGRLKGIQRNDRKRNAVQADNLRGNDDAWKQGRPHQQTTEDHGRIRCALASEEGPMLEACFTKIEEISGLEKANATLLNKQSAKGMIEFLQGFPGIGPKYARDTMMSAYHPLFRENIELDSRIKSVSKVLGVSFEDYREHEQFYLSIAKEAEIEGWELDRLIYGHKDDFLNALRMDER